MNAPEAVWHDLQRIREQAPLVHNITNYVVMNTTANALLALGASPVMAHAIEEIDELGAISGALVINIGTLSGPWIDSMLQAVKLAGERNLPVVVDPVGAGASRLRTHTAQALLDSGAVTVLRGNANEIQALCDSAVQTKGVDADIDVDSAAGAADTLASQYNCTVVVSGEVDLITDGGQTARVFNGHPMMPRVTGLGCTATALLGAFAAVNPNAFQAATHGMAVLGLCGELAAAEARGPGSLQVALLDHLYSLREDDLAGVRLEA